MKPPHEDYCYECTGYGDDYSLDEDGELVWNCPDCPINPDMEDKDAADAECWMKYAEVMTDV